MLYRFLKLLIQVTTKIFFRKIEVRNKSLIPTEGPMIICANHPSTFMDPIVIAAQLKRPIFFLAKGAVFKSGFAQWLLPKLNMIPVYRQQDDASQLGKNNDTFEKCYKHLERGGVIMIFPEGVSLTERKLKKIKTGAARITLVAEARNEFKLNVKILNIGLNYQNPHKFNQNLFMNIDEPIPVDQYKNSYAADTFKAAHELTDEIRIRLEKLIIDIEDENTDVLVRRIEEVYKPKLAKESGFTIDQQHEDFNVTKNIVETVRYYKAVDPGRVERVSNTIDDYFQNLEHAGVNDGQLNEKETKHSMTVNNIQAILFIVFGFPFYVYGLINNWLPFEIPGWLATRLVREKEYRGPLAMTLGIFTFIIFYTLQIMLVWKLSHAVVCTLIYGLVLPWTGFFAYYYWHTVIEIRAGWKLINLFYKRSTLIADLIQQRKEIIREFDSAKEEWINFRSSQEATTEGTL